MVTRRDAFKLGLGAALYALFSKFIPKAQAAPVALGPDVKALQDWIYIDPYCPQGTAYAISGKKVEIIVSQIRNLRDTSPMITKLLADAYESADS